MVVLKSIFKTSFNGRYRYSSFHRPESCINIYRWIQREKLRRIWNGWEKRKKKFRTNYLCFFWYMYTQNGVVSLCLFENSILNLQTCNKSNFKENQTVSKKNLTAYRIVLKYIFRQDEAFRKTMTMLKQYLIMLKKKPITMMVE